MEVSGQLHASAALPPEKQLLLPIREEAGWAPEPFWTRLLTINITLPSRSLTLLHRM